MHELLAASSTRATSFSRLVALLVPILWMVLSAVPLISRAAAPERPNIIVVLVDDYGWTDLGSYGSDFYLTPQMDRLASEGVRFTQAYSACTVCSPSRAALLTGKYPARLRLTDWIPGQMPDNPKLLVPDWTKHLDPAQPTLASVLKKNGYATASVGKWHLGEESLYPEKYGFDLNLGGSSAPRPGSYFSPYKLDTLPDGPRGEYLTDRLGVEAEKFIESHKDRPFFLYLSHFAVHLPVQSKKPLIAGHQTRLRDGQTTHTNAAYAAMIESLDQSVGQLRTKLEELGISERTILVLASDNGGRIPTTSNLPLRAGKGSCYEGGVRVPLVIHWPGVTRPGTVCDAPVIGMDLFPTLLEMADIQAPANDGKSLVPLLRQTGSVERDALFWHYPHYQHYQKEGATPYGAIRAGNYKLIEYFDDMRVELYNLEQDLGEKRNLATEMPAKVDELRARLHAWRHEVGAQMPTRNPDYDPSKPQHNPEASERRSVGAGKKMESAMADRQDSQNPDRVKLTGWIGTRVEANVNGRLVKIDPDRLLEGYRKRPGRHKWDGEHLGKWLHAATLAWANSGNAELRRKMDYVAAELAKCQLPDGYLGTYTDATRWTEWDVWSHKYNLIGLLTYMRYTGNTEALPTCRRMADLLCRTFGDEEGKRNLIKSGQHIGMASTSVLEPMVLLYRLTGEERYLNFCRYILRAWEQPDGPKVLSALLSEKRVDKVGNGKAYEMLSCLNGALEYYRTTGDKRILEACLNAWQDIVDHRLYPTGAASYREMFHGNHDFPNRNKVGETCVTVTWLQFNAQLLRLTGEARFAEQLERVVLNQLFGAQAPDGSAWGYYVQMEGKKPYSPTLDGHCCLSSGPRGIALIPTFAVTTDQEGVVVNLYDAGTAILSLRDGTSVTLVTESRYPVADPARITLSPASKKSFAIRLRIPAWSRNPSVRVNGEAVNLSPGSDGYHAIRRVWTAGDHIELSFRPEPRVLVGDRKNENKFALQYGPLVLAADETISRLAAEQTSRPTVWEIGAAEADLDKLQLTSRPATGAFKTWPGAMEFEIKGALRETTGPWRTGEPVSIGFVPFADAGAGGGNYRVWIPYGKPRPDRNLLLTGMEDRSRKPNFGSIIDGDLECVASTKAGKRAAEDWFSVEVTNPVKVGRVVFVHGNTLPHGGWFDASAGKPRLEMMTRSDGPWEPLATWEYYPATSSSDSAGLKDGTSFTCVLEKPATVYGLRVIGKPSSGENPKQNFATCAELQAFAPDSR